MLVKCVQSEILKTVRMKINILLNLHFYFSTVVCTNRLLYSNWTLSSLSILLSNIQLYITPIKSTLVNCRLNTNWVGSVVYSRELQTLQNTKYKSVAIVQ